MRDLSRPIPVVFAALFFFSACGGGSSSDTAAPAADEATATAVEAAPLGTASVSGSIAFNGTAPKMKRIRQDRECAEMHSEPVMAETVIVNDNGSLRNVFIYVKEGLGDQQFSVPAGPVVFDQSGCVYQPHVFGIMVGQTLKVLNSDPLLHNLHALAEENRPFNFGMPKQGDVRERTFRVPEVMMKIKCDVHPWMGAWAGVVSNPYFAVSGDDGSFSIEGLPAGDYVIEAWHEEYGTTSQSVTVGDGEQATLNFAFGDAAAS